MPESVLLTRHETLLNCMPKQKTKTTLVIGLPEHKLLSELINTDCETTFSKSRLQFEKDLIAAAETKVKLFYGNLRLSTKYWLIVSGQRGQCMHDYHGDYIVFSANFVR